MKIFITGISSGIGRALCKELIDLGHTVWGVARREIWLEDLKRELATDKFIYSVCDISKNEEVLSVVSEMEMVNFLPDTIVLNAGIVKNDLVGNYQNELTKDVFSVNFFGSLIWVEMFLKKFLQRGSGQFIAISSIFAKTPDIGSVSYCASKSALSMAFRSLYLQYYKKGVIFSNIYFGPVDTDISSSYGSEDLKLGFLVISSKVAAKNIIKVMKRKKQIYYFPFFTTMPLKLTLFLSDLIFYKLTKVFRR